MLEPSERDVELTSLDLEWDLGFATFTSTTSIYNHEGSGESDNGGLWASGGEVDGDSRDWNFNILRRRLAAPAAASQNAVMTTKRSSRSSAWFPTTPNSNVDWIIGAFYMDQDNSVYQFSYNPGMNAFHNACIGHGWPGMRRFLACDFLRRETS